MDTVKVIMLAIIVALLFLVLREAKDQTVQLDTVGTELQQVNAQLDLVRQGLPGAGRQSAP